MPFTLHYPSLKTYNCFLSFCSHYFSQKGFPGGSNGKESACSAGDLGLIPGLERSPGEGNGYPVKYSCLSMDRGVWRTTAHGGIELDRTEQLTLSLSQKDIIFYVKKKDLKYGTSNDFINILEYKFLTATALVNEYFNISIPKCHLSVQTDPLRTKQLAQEPSVLCYEEA